MSITEKSNDELFYVSEGIRLYRLIAEFDHTDIDPEDALELSARKWEVVVEFLEENELEKGQSFTDSGVETCALCMLYHHQSNDKYRMCVGCPIFEETGSAGCAGTPYPRFWQDSTLEHGRAMLQCVNEIKDRLNVAK